MAEKPKTLIYKIKKSGRKFCLDEINFLEKEFESVKTNVDLENIVKSFNKNKQWQNVHLKTIELHFTQWNENKSMLYFNLFISFTKKVSLVIFLISKHFIYISY